jgi:hypothetical protein
VMWLQDHKARLVNLTLEQPLTIIIIIQQPTPHIYYNTVILVHIN